jgi:hypothetical protein
MDEYGNAEQRDICAQCRKPFVDIILAGRYVQVCAKCAAHRARVFRELFTTDNGKYFLSELQARYEPDSVKIPNGPLDLSIMSWQAGAVDTYRWIHEQLEIDERIHTALEGEHNE